MSGDDDDDDADNDDDQCDIYDDYVDDYDALWMIICDNSNVVVDDDGNIHISLAHNRQA